MIGGDGFGFAPDDGAWVRIEQLGAGASATTWRSAPTPASTAVRLDDTVIEDGVKLDNLIQIGHNCHIGRHTAMAGCVGAGQQARIGAHCTVGGAGDDPGPPTMPTTCIILRPGGHALDPQAWPLYRLLSIDDNEAWEKNAASLKQLHGLRELHQTAGAPAVAGR